MKYWLHIRYVPVAKRNSRGWKSMDRMCPSWNLNSCKSFPAVKSHICATNNSYKLTMMMILDVLKWLRDHTFTTLSSPPDTTHRPSGLNLLVLIARLCPLYVWMQLFFLISQTFRFVSIEPDAKNSPNGWNSREVQYDRCPLNDRTTAYKQIIWNQEHTLDYMWYT